eukprot:m.1297100 g.1297100  ORF g.1297100 m.1297100 type:complete len:1546 (-) comp24797_c0_seq1:2624-7261(-)
MVDPEAISVMLRVDVAEWLSHLLDQELEEQTFVQQLASGTVLCRLANHLEKKVKAIQSPTGVAINPTERAIRYYKDAIAGTPQAQENISRFKRWASGAGVPDNLIADERDFNTVVTGDSDDNGIHDASNKIVAMLMNISSRQRVVAPPRSVDIGRRMDEGKLPPPGPDEVTLLLRSITRGIGQYYAATGRQDMVPPTVTHAGGWYFDLCCGDDPVPVYLLHNEVLLRVEHNWFTLQMYLAVHLDDYGRQVMTEAPTGRYQASRPTSYMQHHDDDFGSNTELSTTACSQSSVSSATVSRVRRTGPRRAPPAVSTRDLLAQIEQEHQRDIADHRVRLQEQALQQLRTSHDVLKQKLSERDAKIAALEHQVKDSTAALATAVAVQEKQRNELAKRVQEGVSGSIGLARQRENVLHDRLEEVHYFSDQKDKMLAKRYQDMLDAEREAIASRMHAKNVNELQTRDATYRTHLQELQNTVKDLRDQLRAAERAATEARRERDARTPGGSLWNQREKELHESNRATLDNLQNKLLNAHRLLKEQEEAATLERVRLQEDQRKSTQALRTELQEAKSTLLNARAEKRKALVAQEAELRSDYDKRIQQLKADLRDKDLSKKPSIEDVGRTISMDSGSTIFGSNTAAARLEAADTKISLLNDEIMRLQLEVQMRKRKDEEALNNENKVAEMEVSHRKEVRKLQEEHEQALEKAADATAELQRSAAAKENALLREMEELRQNLERANQVAATNKAAAFREGELHAADEARQAAAEQQRRHHDEVAKLTREHADIVRRLEQQSADDARSRNDAAAAKTEADDTLARATRDWGDKVRRLEQELARHVTALQDAQTQAAADARRGEQQRLADEQRATEKIRGLERANADAISDLRQQHEHDLAALRATQERDVDRMQAEHQTATRALRDEKDTQIAALQRDLGEARMQQQSTQSSNDGKMHSLKQSHDRALAELQQRLTAERDVDITRLAAQLEAAKEEIREHLATIAALRKRIAELEAQLRDQRTAFADKERELTSALRDAERQCEEATQANAALEAEIARLTDDLAAASAAKADLEAELQSCKLAADTDSKAASARALELQGQLADAEDRCRRAQEQIQDLEERDRENHALRLAAEDKARAAERAAALAEANAKKSVAEQEEALRMQMLQNDQDALTRAQEAEAWAQFLAEQQRLKTQADQDNLLPFRKDLANWMNRCVVPCPKLTEETLLRDLATGVTLCRLAEALDQDEALVRENERLEAKAGWISPSKKPMATPAKAPGSPSRARSSSRSAARGTTKKTKRKPTPEHGRAGDYVPADATADPTLKALIQSRPIGELAYDDTAEVGTMRARKNIRAFLTWAKTLGLEDPLVFEEDELILYTNVRKVIFGLYDVGRRCRHRVPLYVTLERSRYHPRNRKNVEAADPVDAAVHDILSECICNPRVELTRRSEGLYMLDKLKTPIMLKMSGKKPLIRVGGGFGSFREWLQERDKCRQDKAIQADRAHYETLQRRFEQDGHVLTTDDGHVHDALFTNRTGCDPVDVVRTDTTPLPPPVFD